MIFRSLFQHNRHKLQEERGARGNKGGQSAKWDFRHHIYYYRLQLFLESELHWGLRTHIYLYSFLVSYVSESHSTLNLSYLIYLFTMTPGYSV